MIERMRGERNDHYPDATDEEYDEEDVEYDDYFDDDYWEGDAEDEEDEEKESQNAMENWGAGKIHWDEEEDEEDVGMTERMRGERNNHHPDFEKLDKEIAEENEVYDEEDEEDENYPGTMDDYELDDYWEGDEEDEEEDEEDVGMIERMRGERNDHYPDATDAEYDEEDEEDEEDVGMIEFDKYGNQILNNREYDTIERAHDSQDFEEESEEDDNLDAEYDEEDEENLGYHRSHDKIDFDKNGNQILNNREYDTIENDEYP